jgi:acyl-CoA synthetase (AMP-forming)/AMP-acid ligase II
MIISGGENIYPAELEAVVITHPSVAEVAVVGLSHGKWGEIPVAFVVKRAGMEVAEEDVVNLCKDRLASFKCVREVRFLEALPKNQVGKVLKTVLRAQ